jgi:DNA-binding PadR family transcriptional regulator
MFIRLIGVNLRRARWSPVGMLPEKLSLTLSISLNIYMNMTRKQAEQFLPLKPQWFHILLALAGEEQHGYGIMQEVLERTMGKVRLWPATLYGSLKRMIEADLIEESSKRPRPELDDARRRYYRLTLLGRQVLDQECERLQGLVHAIQTKRRLMTE